MEGLEAARRRIDGIDREMAALFEQRMQAVAQVIAAKKAAGLPVLDANREDAVIRAGSALMQNDEYIPYYRDFIRSLMEISKAYQRADHNRGVVGYQGVEGAFSHIALTRLFQQAESRAYPTFEAVFKAVQSGEIAHGVIPFENSFTGEVGEVLDLLLRYDCVIGGVYDLRISHNLLALPGAAVSGIRKVYSHPQAISQCQDFLAEHDFEVIPHANTAMAAKLVAEGGDATVAAIASMDTARRYGLAALARGINTSADNTTRFIVIGRQLQGGGNRFNIIFTTGHEPGRLAGAMQLIASMGYNLESIKSRPLRDVPWQYYFYAEIVGRLSDPAAQQMVAALGKQCGIFKVVGAYTVDKKSRGEE